MRNKVFGRQLGRGRKGREALLKGLMKAVVENGSITTTLAKAKAVQPDLEKLMSYVVKNDVSARRGAYAMFANDREVTNKLFELTALAASRNSGYTTISRLPHRKGDGAEMATIGWVSLSKESAPAESKESDKSQVTSSE
jgi:large subunit ribosomal protein L17